VCRPEPIRPPVCGDVPCEFRSRAACPLPTNHVLLQIQFGNESGLQRSTDVSYHAAPCSSVFAAAHTPVNTTQTGSGSGPKNCGFNSQRTEHGIICPHYRPSDKAYREKIQWWRKGYDWRADNPPKLVITGERLILPLHASIPIPREWNHKHAFIMSGVDIPTLGAGA